MKIAAFIFLSLVMSLAGLADDLKDVDDAKSVLAKEYFLKGENYYAAGNLIGATTYYKLAVSTNPRYEDAYKSLIKNYILLSEQAKLNSKNKLVEFQDPKLIDYLDLGDLNFTYGDYDKSIRFYESALNIDIYSSRAYNGLARIYVTVADRVKGGFKDNELFYDSTKSKTKPLSERAEVTQAPFYQLAPLRFSSPNQLHGIFDIPPLEGMGITPKKSLYLFIDSDIATTSSIMQDKDSNSAVNYDIFEFRMPIEVRYGVFDGVEVSARVTVAAASGGDTTRDIIDRGIIVMTSDESASGLADAVLGAKYNFYTSRDLLTGISGAAYLKLPLSDDSDLFTNSGPTYTFLLSGSYKIARSTVLHSNLGFTVVNKDAFNDTTSVSELINLGVGVSHAVNEDLTVMAQVQTCTNALTALKIYEGEMGPLNAGVGIRYNWRAVSLESGVAAGLSNTSYDFLFHVGFGYKF